MPASINDSTSGHSNTDQVTESELPQENPGEKVSGDFDGDGRQEGAGINRSEAKEEEYVIHFASSKLPQIEIGCCGSLLVNEGDLNNDGGDELNVFQSPYNGCTNSLRTYTYSNNKWRALYEPFMFSVGCSTQISEQEYLDWVVAEKGEVYYHIPDPNDEDVLSEDGSKIVFSNLMKVKAKVN